MSAGAAAPNPFEAPRAERPAEPGRVGLGRAMLAFGLAPAVLIALPGAVAWVLRPDWVDRDGTAMGLGLLGVGIFLAVTWAASGAAVFTPLHRLGGRGALAGAAAGFLATVLPFWLVVQLTPPGREISWWALVLVLVTCFGVPSGIVGGAVGTWVTRSRAVRRPA